MWGPWDLSDPLHDATIEHSEVYDFVEVSQNNWQRGQIHYDNLLRHRQRIASSPRPLNNAKIYGADGSTCGTTRDGLERFWRSIFAGAASARFHRPDSGLGLSDTAQCAITGAREVTGAIDLFRCEPRPELLFDKPQGNRLAASWQAPVVSGNRAYCLANPGKEYAVYFPDGGSGVMLDLRRAKGDFQVRWFHIDAGRWATSSRIQAGDKAELSAPALGQWSAVIQR